MGLLVNLPEPATLHRHTRAIAVLEAVLEPRPRRRFARLDRLDRGRDVYTVRHDDGDLVLLHIEGVGHALVGQSPFTPTRHDLTQVLPTHFSQALDVDSATFAAWSDTKTGWVIGFDTDPESTALVLEPWLGGTLSFLDHVEKHHGLRLPRGVVEQVLTKGVLSRRRAFVLHPQLDWDQLAAELHTMGVPIVADRSVPGVPLTKTLEQLDGVQWGPPTFPSGLVTRCHALRTKPLEAFTPADLRVLVGQALGLPWTLRLALAFLELNPLLDAEFYPGDLLYAVSRVPPEVWRAHTAGHAVLVERLHGIETEDRLVTAALETLRAMEF